MTELPKTFDPAEIERRWYAHWESTGQFRPDRPGAEPWTIVNPPPNVTGSLHIGHALDNTLQDVLVRHARLKGKDALWVVGTDHAGIATQMVVERQLALHQQKRTDFSREEFVAKVWEWKAESGGEITQQLRRLGCSMAWDYRSTNGQGQFTMDPHFSKAVLKVFVDLYNEGLIYRDKRLVNWDPGLGTAISDLEVETREVNGQFWHLRYPLEDAGSEAGAGGSGFISVATTRPETMLADMAVAVNPADGRYTALIGKNVRLPITGRLIPIIADEHADPELGSGAVKITPGHDFNDFEVGKRAGLKAGEMLNMLDAKAQVTQTADGLIPDELLGLDRGEARKRVVAILEEQGFLDRVEDRVIQTPFGDRSGEVIEPWLTDQWYVDAAALAKAPIEAVTSGAIKIVPKSWEKTFFNWMENIQPWCVSRQLWWGHRIPAWWGTSKETIEAVKRSQDAGEPLDMSGSTGELHWFVAENEVEALADAKAYYGSNKVSVVDAQGFAPDPDDIKIAQDPDVLDTWFSSALWPFATLGWPHENPPRDGEGDHAQHGGGGGPRATTLADSPPHRPADGSPPRAGGDLSLGGRYPNDVLVSGFDILFFWDARMMMQGMHFMKDVPFRTLYLHGLVRAADGQKMSKSKGNVVNPLGLIDRYGADALRFFMAAMESQGRDIKMDEKRVEGYRNFATKLWNAARFCQANGIGASDRLEAPAATLAVNKWIIGETIQTVQAVDLALADYRFDGAANAIYQFAWSRFCDWYLELIKPVLNPSPSGEGQGVGGASQSVAPAERPHPNPSPEGEGLEASETRAVAGWVLDQILVMLHPFMPFVTEELWSKLGERDHDLIVAKWPMADAYAIDPEASAEIDRLIDTIEGLRSERLAVGFKPIDILPTGLVAADDDDLAFLNQHLPTIRRMARLAPAVITSPSQQSQTWGYRPTEKFEHSDEFSQTSFITAQLQAAGLNFVVWTKGFIDLDAERARLTKAIDVAAKERDSLAARLANPSFVERAKPEAVEKARADHADKAAEAERLSAALARLG